MTILQIITELAPHKRLSRQAVYSVFAKLDIKPAGTLRQKPQQYPDDTADRIRQAYGLTNSRPTPTTPPAKAQPARVLTLAEIKRKGARK